MRYFTIEEADKHGLEELYVFSPDCKIIDSGYGKITVKEFYEREVVRIGNNPLRIAAVISKAHNSNEIAVYVNLPIIWEKQARAMGYSPFTDWSPPDTALAKLGYIEPVSMIRDRYRQAMQKKRAVVVRQDNGINFAIFCR